MKIYIPKRTYNVRMKLPEKILSTEKQSFNKEQERRPIDMHYGNENNGKMFNQINPIRKPLFIPSSLYKERVKKNPSFPKPASITNKSHKERELVYNFRQIKARPTDHNLISNSPSVDHINRNKKILKIKKLVIPKPNKYRQMEREDTIKEKQDNCVINKPINPIGFFNINPEADINRESPEIGINIIENESMPQLKPENDQNGFTRKRKAKDRISCNCKKSKCVRLHCVCFTKDLECSIFCHCEGCLNTNKFAEARSKVITITKQINSTAFTDKVKKVGDKFINIRGCNCVKSNCTKKYCECFKFGTGCTEICSCIDCENTKFEEKGLIQLKEKRYRKKDKLVIGGVTGLDVSRVKHNAYVKVRKD